MSAHDCQEFCRAMEASENLTSYDILEIIAGRSFDNMIVVAQANSLLLRGTRDRGMWNLQVGTPGDGRHNWLSVYILSSYIDRRSEITRSESIGVQVGYVDSNYSRIIEILNPNVWRDHKERIQEVGRQLVTEFIERADDDASAH